MDLFFHTDSPTKKRIVAGLDKPDDLQIGELHQEDGGLFTIYPVKTRSSTSEPYFAYVGATGYAAKISLGIASTIYASIDLATITADGNGITGSPLDLNTSQINALAADSPVIFEVRLYSVATGYLRCHQQVAIRKSVALAAAVNPVVNDTALGKIEASATYAPFELPAGKGFKFTSQDGTKTGFVYLDNDGTFKIPGLT
jgi:hypothetical protein